MMAVGVKDSDRKWESGNQNQNWVKTSRPTTDGMWVWPVRDCREIVTLRPPGKKQKDLSLCSSGTPTRLFSSKGAVTMKFRHCQYCSNAWKITHNSLLNQAACGWSIRWICQNLNTSESERGNFLPSHETLDHVDTHCNDWILAMKFSQAMLRSRYTGLYSWILDLYYYTVYLNVAKATQLRLKEGHRRAVVISWLTTGV